MNSLTLHRKADFALDSILKDKISLNKPIDKIKVII